MPLASSHTSIADYYFGLLENLNSNSKLDLISKLSLSIKEESGISERSLQSLFGAYKSEEDAETIIEELKKSKLFNRNIESL